MSDCEIEAADIQCQNDDSETLDEENFKQKRREKLGFKPQRELNWNKYLPYADKLDDESHHLLANIKENLAKAIAMRDIKPGLSIFSARLSGYLTLYGLKFTKEDHIKFVKLYVNLICLEGLEPLLMTRFCQVFLQLMKKPHILSPDDLQIEWKPLYRVCEIYLIKDGSRGYFHQIHAKYNDDTKTNEKNVNFELIHSMIDRMFPFMKILGGASNFLQYFSDVNTEKDNRIDASQSHLKSVIKTCSLYFPKSSTKEILSEILPKLEPLDNGKSSQAFEILNLFLNFNHGYELWFDDIMNIWNTYQNRPWNDDIISIMADLAFENIGKIDWEPHLPVMFSRILSWLDLPVYYKNKKTSKCRCPSANSISKWIVSTLGPNTSGQKYLTKLIGAIESYLHPANSGKWIKVLGQLLVYLPERFIQRLEYERYRKPDWKRPIPDSNKLTEECITKFVESLKSAAFQAMYSKVDSNEVCKIFRHLSNLRPELIIPGVIEQVYANLESLTEPHRLTASLYCLVGISRALINGCNGYTNGRTHIIPILLASLNGIDTNDIRKSFLTMNFYGVFLFQMPIVDCSKAGQYYDDLTEEETLICEQTADLEDFVLQFIDRLFLMMKFATQESVRMEQTDTVNIKSRQDVIIENSLSSALQVVLGQCSEDILQSATKRVTDFVQNNVLDPRTGASLLGTLVYSISYMSGETTFKILVPYLYEKIINYIHDHDDVENIEKQSDEFLYYLTILFTVFKGDPREVIKYFDDYLIPILDKVMKFSCKLTQKIIASLIFHICVNLSRLQIFENKAMDENLKKPLSEYLPIRHWGEKMKPNEKFNWFIPGESERLACEKLLHRYLPELLDRFDKYVNGDLELTREETLRDLNYILSLLSLSNFLPNWNEPPKQLIDTVVDFKHFDIIFGLEGKEIHMPDGENVRLRVIRTLTKLQDKLLESSSDDTQSLRSIASIWERVHKRRSFVGSYEMEMKSYKHLKQYQEFKLEKRIKHVKAVVAKRIMIQQSGREELSRTNFTETHCKVLKKLLELSTSHYSDVRILAQDKLLSVLRSYPFAQMAMVDDLDQLLKIDPTENHEAFKGALYVLLGSSSLRPIINNNWRNIQKLWLTLLQTKPSEKPSILNVLDYILSVMVDEFITLQIELVMDDKIIEQGLQLLNNNNNKDNNDDVLSSSKYDLELGKKRLENQTKENREICLNMMNSIVDITKNLNLHWRYHYMATIMIQMLVHPDVDYPPSVAKFTLQNLINDSIKERKQAFVTLASILRQQKPKQIRINANPYEIAGITKPIDDDNYKLSFGIRDDNRWLQYDLNTLPKSQEEWDKLHFVHKCDGFFGWSKDFKIYAPSDQQPKLDRNLDEMNEVQRIIYEFFSNKENLEKLMSFWSLEENKGKEKFKRLRFTIVQYLFKSYGDAFLDNFLMYIEKFIKDKNAESSHRCAAELLSGILRGMKHWPYNKTQKAYEKLMPIIRLALNSITVETDELWGVCFATAAQNIDPRKQYWLYEVLFENPIQENTSFVDCSRVFCLQGPFNQHVWRMNSYSHRLLEYLRPYLNHQFQIVRSRLSSILINIFEADIQFKNANPPECPRVKDMIAEVMEKLKPLNQEPISDSENEEEIRLFKTISMWIIGFLSRCSNGNTPYYFDLLPYACRFESSEKDSELAGISTAYIALLSQALTFPDRMEYALNKIDEISKSPSWNARLAVIDALQVLVFHNMSIILSRDEWVQKVQNIVLRLLEDSILEVREKSAQVLGGLLHCSFLPATDKLLEQFKKKCRTKVVRRSMYQRSTNYSMESRTDLQETDAVRMRHTGVLGLCAFISAFPYDIPDFIPDVFEHLGAHLNDPQPIPTTIRKTVSNFKRTHHDNWAVHQLKFTEDQLAVLSDLTIPPSYYV